MSNALGAFSSSNVNLGPCAYLDDQNTDLDDQQTDLDDQKTDLDDKRMTSRQT